MPEQAMANSFEQLMQAVKAGDDDAVRAVVDQHTAALVAVARRQIGTKLRRRIDPEDVVQSAYRSFFLRAERGEFELGTGQALWKLLVTITLNKVRRQGKYHRAQKRTIELDHSVDEQRAPIAAGVGPGPAEAAMLVDEVANFLSQIPENNRPVLELRLRGLSTVEIATELGRSDRVVRRVLSRAMEQLQPQD